MTLLWIKRCGEADFSTGDKFTKYHSQILLTSYDICERTENLTDRRHVIWFKEYTIYYKYKQYIVKHNSINDFIKVYFLHCFIQRHVSALVMAIFRLMAHN